MRVSITHPNRTGTNREDVDVGIHFVADTCTAAATSGHALVLLYTSGLCLGELLRLTLDDADPQAGVLRIRESKFHKSRWVPLSSSACAELREYLQVRQRCGMGVRSS
jgi:site-specific recombinase XerD